MNHLADEVLQANTKKTAYANRSQPKRKDVSFPAAISIGDILRT